MYYRRFGRTELQMPVFSCGGMRYQQSWSDISPADVPEANQDNLEATIHRAIDLGINHIETARGYGSSEMQLGSILPHLPRNKIIVQTKVAPSADPQEFLATFEKSMAYLKLDYVDLFSIHGINNQELLDLTLRKGGCIEVAEQLRQQGRVRHIGFSTHAPSQVIRTAIASDAFDYVNLHWYFVNDSNWQAVLDAKKKDMGVFIISPNDKGGLLYKPSEKLQRLCQPLTPMHFNDLYCLHRPEVHTLSLGASKPSDFDEHIHALKDYHQIEKVMPQVEARLRQAMQESLGQEWLQNWEQGLPSSDDIPGQVNIWEILRLWNYAKSLDMIEYGKMRYNLLGNADHWFAGNQANDLDALDLRPALVANPFKEKIPSILREAHTLLVGEPKKRLSQSD
ncbi:MAG: aldo/keto reductase [Blastochloris sp.]|nr:aldo/keto reductase [Blastochloris sp.]